MVGIFRHFLCFVVHDDSGVRLIIIGDLFEQGDLDGRILHLLLDVEVDCVVIGRELISLEELNCRLIQLQHYYLVQ